MQYLSGREAVRLAVAEKARMETEEGMIVFPRHLWRQSLPLRSAVRRERLPEFCPATPEEAYYMARSAGLYADTYGTAILVRLSEEVGSGRMCLSLGKRTRTERRRGEYRRRETGSSMQTGTEYCAGHVSRALLPGQAFSDSAWNRREGRGSAGVIVRGAAYLRLKEILNGCRELRILKLGTVWPIPEECIREYLAELRSALVLDETRTELLTHIYAVKGKYELRCRIREFHGEEQRAEDIAAALRSFLGERQASGLLWVGAPPERSLAGLPLFTE